MKRIAIAATSAAALLLVSAASAAGGLSGTYKTTIHSKALAGGLNGTWTISFKSGAYTVTDNGKVVLKGKITTTGAKLAFKDKSGQDSCPGTGTYTYKVTASKLKFTRVSDSSCTGRSTVLAGSFTKIG